MLGWKPVESGTRTKSKALITRNYGVELRTKASDTFYGVYVQVTRLSRGFNSLVTSRDNVAVLRCKLR